MIDRADKKRNIDKVTASLINNPLQTEREIAIDTGLANWTAHALKKEVEQNWAKDDRIVSLTDKDLNCIKLWVAEIERRLGDKDELAKLRMTEISQVIRENTVRYTLFRGDVTNDDGWLKINTNVSWMTPEEVDAQIKEALK